MAENPIQQRDQIQKNNSGGAFMAFNGNSCVSKGASKEASQVSSFSLVTPASELSHQSNSKISGCGGSSSAGSSLLRVEIQSQQPQPPQHLQQNPRKQRRCWSPELHRRFVDALHQLGGAQGSRLCTFGFIIFSFELGGGFPFFSEPGYPYPPHINVETNTEIHLRG